MRAFGVFDFFDANSNKDVSLGRIGLFVDFDFARRLAFDEVSFVDKLANVPDVFRRFNGKFDSALFEIFGNKLHRDEGQVLA